MSFSADKLIIEIDGDTSPLAGALGKIQGIGKKVFTGIAGAVGGASAAVSGFIKNAIDEFADFEQQVGGVETLFGESAPKVIENASRAFMTAGVSANTYMANVTSFSASLLQSLAGDTDKAADIADMAMRDMADNANKMGTAMGSIQDAYQGFAKQNYTMLDNLKLGYGGTKTEMERLLADAEKLTGVKYDISNLSDVFEAIHAIQYELGITGTTADEAERTISGSLFAMKAAWSNLLVGVADDTQDFDTLVNNFVESASTAFRNLMPRISTSIKGIGKLITGLLPVIVATLPSLISDVLPSILQSGIDVVMTFLQGITDNLPVLTSAAPDIMWALFDGIMAMLPMIGDIARELVGLFVQGFLMYNALIFELDITIITALLQGLADNVDSIVDTAVTLILQLVDSLITNIPLVITAAVEIIKGLAEGIVANVSVLIDAALEIIDTLITGLLDSLPAIIEAALKIIMALGEGLIAAIPRLVDAAFQIIDGIIDFLINNLPAIIEAGVTLLVSLVQAMPEIVSQIVARLPEIITGIVDTLIANLPVIVDAGIELFLALIEALPEIIETIVKAIPQIIIAIATSLWENRDEIVEAGKDLIMGLWEGIQNMWETVKGWIGGLWDGLVGGVKSAFGIQSPSKVFMGIGENLMLGLEEGLSDGLSGVLSEANRITDEVADSFGIQDLFSGAKVAFSAGLSGGFSVPAYAFAGGGGGGISPIVNQTIVVQEPHDYRKIALEVVREVIR